MATWKPTDATPPQVARSSLRATVDGFFASDRWHVGEHIREKFTLQIPVDWKGDGIAFDAAQKNFDLCKIRFRDADCLKGVADLVVKCAPVDSLW